MIECLCFSTLTFGYLPTNMMKFLMYQENVTLSRSSTLYILYFEVILKIQDQVYAIGNEFCCWCYIWTWKYPFKKTRHHLLIISRTSYCTNWIQIITRLPWRCMPEGQIERENRSGRFSNNLFEEIIYGYSYFLRKTEGEGCCCGRGRRKKQVYRRNLGHMFSGRCVLSVSALPFPGIQWFGSWNTMVIALSSPQSPLLLSERPFALLLCERPYEKKSFTSHFSFPSSA